jgi:hypothetical protein
VKTALANPDPATGQSVVTIDQELITDALLPGGDLPGGRGHLRDVTTVFDPQTGDMTVAVKDTKVTAGSGIFSITYKGPLSVQATPTLADGKIGLNVEHAQVGDSQLTSIANFGMKGLSNSANEIIANQGARIQEILVQPDGIKLVLSN